MKLLNRSLLYLSVLFFFIIGIWAVIFYINLKDEIRDSIDDGLENNKLLLIQKVATDSTLLLQREFGGNNFEIHPVSKTTALQTKDVYKDTLMYRQNENDMEPVRILHSAFQFQDKFYRIKIISSLVEEDDLIEDAFWSLVWLFIILVGSVIIINNIILRRIWNPFHEIVGRLRKYRLEKDQTPIAVKTRTSEFMELQQAANALISHSKEAFESQKQFTENASHELQTPLAIINNKLELLLESKNLTQADAQALAEIIKMVERMAQLNRGLLLLAKIENKQFVNAKKINLEELAKENLAPFEEYIDYKQITVKTESVDKPVVEIDPALAQVLMGNLIKNALFHNRKDGQLILHFSKTEFSICNTASATPLNADTIFQRFQKDPSNTQSTGLGLSVCKAICDMYGFHISYRFVKQHHCFVIGFTKNTKSV